jgi:hypothetical protein
MLDPHVSLEWIERVAAALASLWLRPRRAFNVEAGAERLA